MTLSTNSFVNMLNKFSSTEAFYMLIFDTFLYLFIYFYLDKVIPNVKRHTLLKKNLRNKKDVIKKKKI